MFPSAHAELYGEFARLELPRTIRDFLTAPQNTGAYTIGANRAFRTPDAGAVRVALELTNLEQTRYFTDRPPPPDYYTGRAAGAGFTSRGQPLGAAIGPGSSSQWLGADYYGARGQVGVYLRRERLQNDALYRQFLANALRHDVSFGGGVRGGIPLLGYDLRVDLSAVNRLNYLFQNGVTYQYSVGTVDVMNYALTFDLAPRGHRAAR